MEKKKYNITVGNETKNLRKEQHIKLLQKSSAVVFLILPFLQWKEKTDCRN